MNGLLPKYYISVSNNFDETKFEEEGQTRRLRKNYYQTWPPRKLFSRKFRISKTINQLKSDQAISEIDLSYIFPKNLTHLLHQETPFRCRNIGKLNELEPMNSQKCHFIEVDIMLRMKNKVNENGSHSDPISDSITVAEEVNYVKRTSDSLGYMRQKISMKTDCSDQKLGIIDLLKNWKLNEDCCEKNQELSEATNDTRSSVSSINTLNENENFMCCLDATHVTTFPFKSSRNSEFRNRIVSSSHLIQHHRPGNLPPKPLNEQIKHQKEYERMVEALKKKERRKDLVLLKNHEDRLKKEEMLSQSTQTWLNEILPNWKCLKNSKKIHNLWWNGLPPCIRGKVWSLSMGNELRITRELYDDCVKKFKEILRTGSRDFQLISENYEHSVELIRLDISRTFPHLCIFQQGGPYHDILHNLLGAFVCYQPEMGYVQGMSFIAAVLLLNMDELDAFVCFANMLSKPCHKAFYSLDVQKMKTYYLVFSDLLRVNMYDLYNHVNETALSPDLYLVDWVYTLFSKSMNLDVACRIWDLIFRDGETFIFRAALGILHLFKSELLKMDFLLSAQYLTKLPEELSSEKLFKSISHIRMTNGSLTFDDLLEQYFELSKTSA